MRHFTGFGSLNFTNGTILRKTSHMLRSSRPDVFCEKGVLRNFVTFTVKHPCQSLFFNKVGGLRHATLLKKEL